jgi:Putative peptidoglycan binding domain
MGKTAWHDINDLGGPPASLDKDKEWTMPPPPVPEPEKPKEKLPPEFQFVEIKVIVPADGLKEGKPFDVEGVIELLVSNPQRLQIFLDAITKYGDNPDDSISFRNEAVLDRQTNKFRVTFKSLRFHQDFLRDREKPANATFMLVIKAYGPGAEDDSFSDPVTLPMATKDVVLKKGCYDDVWSGAPEHAEEYPKSSENYIAGDKVKKLQENLIRFELLDKSSTTGYFGDKTEAAVKLLQTCAARRERKKSKERKIFKLDPDKVTFKCQSDGVVDSKTGDEIAIWFQKEYVKPAFEAYKGDFDEEGYQNDKGKRNDPGYHEGYPIMEIENLLCKVKAYAGECLGFISPEVYAALKYFQQHAAKGEFQDKKGNKVVVQEKLSGHRDGVACEKTKDSLKAAVDKGLVVPESAKNDEKTGYNIDKAVAYLNLHAEVQPKGSCATYVWNAIQAGGRDVGTTKYAKNFGPYLIQAGFTEVPAKDYDPAKANKGDVMVIQDYPGQNEPAGHMQMYNGETWVSDFKQPKWTFWPGQGFIKNMPAYQVYR